MKNETLSTLLEQRRKYYGISQQEIAARTGMSLRSYQIKVKNPDTFTVGQMKKIAKTLHFNYEVQINGQI